MEAVREISSDKAARIVEAMRESVAARGATGSTFDHVAREAGVSRGLVHYYFGTKERLLVEVVRRECEISEERFDRAVADAATAEEVIAALVRSFEDFLGDGDQLTALFYELLMLAQRNDEIASELGGLGRRMRGHLAGVLEAKASSGALELRGGPDAVAGVLFALADGLTVRHLTEPGLDMKPMMVAAISAARSLLS